jgi:hypothetical protein
MGTWIYETDQAIYWMEAQYYLDKIVKTPVAAGGSEAVVVGIKRWFASDQPPGTMRIVRGAVTEPTAKPVVIPPASGIPSKPGTRWVASPNFNSRNGTPINTIVAHNTAATLSSTINTFQDPNAQVSAHYVVARTGEIVQMVKDSDRAWHAGDRVVNDQSIGIEHEATYDAKGLTPAQEKSSITLIKYLIAAYKIPLGNIKTHRNILRGATECPVLIWATDADFEQWKKTKLV